jgi:flavin-dependent dehydrogenase
VSLDPGALAIFSRTAFDGRLFHAAQEAGAIVVTERVAELEKAAGRFRLRATDGTTWNVPLVVGADGANGLVRRRMLTVFDRSQISIATGFFVHGVTSREIVLEFTSDPPGYLWSFPRPDHLAVGICAQADAGVSPERLRTRAATWIDQAGLGRGERLVSYSWPIPSLDAHAASTMPCSGDGWLLVGDAAGFVDPITREGIFFALLSADHAAASMLAGGPIGEHYERRIRELRLELARAARLKHLFFRPAFIDLLLSTLRNSARIRSVMADLVAGTQSYRDLKWRLVKTREVAVAWRLLSAISRQPTLIA